MLQNPELPEESYLMADFRCQVESSEPDAELPATSAVSRCRACNSPDSSLPNRLRGFRWPR